MQVLEGAHASNTVQNLGEGHGTRQDEPKTVGKASGQEEVCVCVCVLYVGLWGIIDSHA